MKRILHAFTGLALLLGAVAAAPEGFRTRDEQATADPNVLPVRASGGPEARPSKGDPEGHWGAAVEGFELSVRFATNTAIIGEPFVAYAFLRNSTNRPLDYLYDLPGKPSTACDLSMTDEHGRRLPYTGKGLPLFASSRTYRLPPLTQDRFFVRMDKAFSLRNPGVYEVRAKGSVVSLDGKRIVQISSGPAIIHIVPRGDSANAPAPPERGALPATTIPATNSDPKRP